MQRLDLIISERELERVLPLIDAARAPGYTVMRHVTGRGPHGMVSESMEFSGFGANAHVIVFCEPAVLEALQLGLKPILDYYGGVGFVSTAEPF
ncbi:transcriptional regulator [Synechococcus sp. CS-1325]|uniref:P-II family nitrogen regulator n=1 Tax=unclassified Synechococcus TaxID=2626047 RepID=UPI000DB68A04|nr:MULTISPECIES: transcriptional regulator [unclassified Synechococcus]PZU96981.1 MAG: transcriptional regulator [Cyanobium sp.]MCT0198257.1 transcriptional regulator [Synechococcus sp. CS-1325]MCT0213666.1 transcriptional regulator [Synechococcus sp. CS-1326]MCT0229575.1 transcriptional regulator [Synechococcus sp. CS-1324]MCT0234117.1 transcriptional regulator [Synechococcus sp. CS-1327]